jgi:hypothetical protein
MVLGMGLKGEVRGGETNNKPLKSLVYKKNKLLYILFIFNIILVTYQYLIIPILINFTSYPINIRILNLNYGLYYLMILIRLLSGGFVYYDANKINAGRLSSYKPKYSMVVSWTPFLWAILVLFIPIIPFIIYIYKRKEIFKANHPGYYVEFNG